MNLYYYLDISLEFEKEIEHEITAVYFKNNIIKAVTQLFGEVAGTINVDLLKYNQDSRRAILRVPKEYYVKLRSSLTLCGYYEGLACAYRIHKASPLLLSLQGDSRNFKF